MEKWRVFPLCFFSWTYPAHRGVRDVGAGRLLLRVLGDVVRSCVFTGDIWLLSLLMDRLPECLLREADASSRLPDSQRDAKKTQVHVQW